MVKLIAKNIIKNVAEKMDALPKCEPTHLEKDEALKTLKPHIRKLEKKNYSITEIASILTKLLEVEISERDVSKALTVQRKRRKINENKESQVD